MNLITLLTESAAVVEVPKDAIDLKIDYDTHWTNDDMSKLIFTSEILDPLKCCFLTIRLPPGNWSILCEYCRQDIDNKNIYYLKTTKESFDLLMKSHNIDLSKRWVLIVKK